MISITIASRHKDDRKTINTLLSGEGDFKIASAGEDGYHAVRSSMTLKPDIIVMDYNMVDAKSVDISPIIKRNSPSTDLIALCPDKESCVIDKALKAGISGFLSWKKDLDKLVSAIRSVFYGGLYISELAKNQLLGKLGHMNTESPFRQHIFSMTEYNILNGIIMGQTDKEIAENLNMTTGGVRNCLNKVKKRTGLQNRTQITVYALLSGIINFTNVKDSLLVTLK